MPSIANTWKINLLKLRLSNKKRSLITLSVTCNTDTGSTSGRLMLVIITEFSLFTALI